MRFIAFLECPKNDTAAIKTIHRKFVDLHEVLGLNYKTGAAIDGDKAKIWYIVKSSFCCSSMIWMQIAQRLGGCYLLLFDLEVSNVYTLKPNGEIRQSYAEHMNWHSGLSRLVPQGVDISALVSFATDDYPIYDESLARQTKAEK